MGGEEVCHVAFWGQINQIGFNECEIKPYVYNYTIDIVHFFLMLHLFLRFDYRNYRRDYCNIDF